jgi:hypothetical protein
MSKSSTQKPNLSVAPVAKNAFVTPGMFFRAE